MFERLANRRALLFVACVALLWGLEWWAISHIARSIHFGWLNSEHVRPSTFVATPLLFAAITFAVAFVGKSVAGFLSNRARAALLVLATIPIAAILPRVAAIALCHAARLGHTMLLTDAFGPDVWIFRLPSCLPTLRIGLLVAVGIAVIARFVGARRVLLVVAITGLAVSSLGAIRARERIQPARYFSALRVAARAQVYMPTDPHALRSLESVFLFRIRGREYFYYQNSDCVRPPLALHANAPTGWPGRWTPNPFWNESLPTIYAGVNGGAGLFEADGMRTLFDLRSLSPRPQQLDEIAPAMAAPWIWLASAAFASLVGLAVAVGARPRGGVARLSARGPYRSATVVPTHEGDTSDALEVRCTTALCFTVVACAPLIGAWGTGVLW